MWWIEFWPLNDINCAQGSEGILELIQQCPKQPSQSLWAGNCTNMPQLISSPGENWLSKCFNLQCYDFEEVNLQLQLRQPWDSTAQVIILTPRKVCHVPKKHKALKNEIKGFTKNVFNLSISPLYECLQFIAAVVVLCSFFIQPKNRIEYYCNMDTCTFNTLFKKYICMLHVRSYYALN